MIDSECFGDVPEIDFSNNAKGRQDWKEVFIKTYVDYARSKNVDEQTIDQVTVHNRENDYPMTLDEVVMLLEGNGYTIDQVIPFDQIYPDIPISPYFGIIVAHPLRTAP